MIRRHSIFLLCLAFAGFDSGVSDAGCCDWLFGRPNTAYVAGYPYVASYPPVAIACPPAPVSGVYQAQMPS